MFQTKKSTTPNSKEDEMTEPASSKVISGSDIAAPTEVLGRKQVTVRAENPTVTSSSQAELPEYEVLKRLGEGGMGVIFAVRDKKNQNILALKVLKPEFADDTNLVARFEQEARSTAELTHPNIGKVFGLARDTENAPYLVMEYIDGETLAQWLARNGAFLQKHALVVATQMLQALSHAHSKGVIHRDLKPSNVMLSVLDDGSIHTRLVDFGIARLSQAGVVSGLTQTGEVIGSPQYMSPEQCRGEQTDARSDIYSMGCLLFETLTNKPFAEGQNPMQILMCHLEGSNKLQLATLSKHDVSKSLIEVITKMLEKDPTKRYQSADAVLTDLARLQANKSIARKLNLKIAVAGVLAACIMGLAVVAYQAYSSQSAVSSPSITGAPAFFSSPQTRAQQLLDQFTLVATENITWKKNEYTQDKGEERNKKLEQVRAAVISELTALGPGIIPTLITEYSEAEPDYAGGQKRRVCTTVLSTYKMQAFLPIVEELKNLDGRQSDVAGLASVVGDMGAEALPPTLRLINSSDLKAQEAGVRLLEAQTRAIQYSADAQLDVEAARTKILDLFAREAALSQLPQHVRNDGLQEAILKILSNLKPTDETTEAIKAFFENEHEQTPREYALRALGKIGRKETPEKSIGTAKFLANVLANNPQSNLRSVAAYSLGESGSNNTAAIPELMAATHDKSEAVRKAALGAICANGTQAALPGISIALDPQSGVQQQALDVVSQMGPKAKSLSPQLLKLRQSQESRREYIDQILARINGQD